MEDSTESWDVREGVDATLLYLKSGWSKQVEGFVLSYCVIN
jgi:hypothetical protein